MTSEAYAALNESHVADRTPGNVDARYLAAAAQEGIIDLEQAADALLAAYGALGKEVGIYTDNQLSRKMRQETLRLPKLDETQLSEDTINYISQLQIDELSREADLTPMQDVCYRLHCGLLSINEIADILGLTYQVVASHLRRARIKTIRIYREGRYAGWYQIYLSEVNRTGCRMHRTGGPYTSNRP